MRDVSRLVDWEKGLIDGMSPAFLKNLFRCFLPQDHSHYVENVRNGWKQDGMFFLGEKLRHEPSRVEWMHEARETHLCERALCHYVLVHPEKVSLKNNLDNSKRLLVEMFLEEADGAAAEAGEPGRGYAEHFLGDYSI
jgi:hypothetical protein